MDYLRSAAAWNRHALQGNSKAKRGPEKARRRKPAHGEGKTQHSAGVDRHSIVVAWQRMAWRVHAAAMKRLAQKRHCQRGLARALAGIALAKYGEPRQRKSGSNHGRGVAQGSQGEAWRG